MTQYAVVFRPDGTNDVCENPPCDLVSPADAVELVRDGKRAYVSVMDAGTTNALLRELKPDGGQMRLVPTLNELSDEWL